MVALLHLLRVCVICAIATLMALMGMLLLRFPWTGLINLWIVAASILIWIPLGYWVRRTDFVMAIVVGCLSPFLGAALVLPPYSLFLVILAWHTTIPVGVATAVLMKLALAAEAKFEASVYLRRSVCPRCRYNISASISAGRCPECGLVWSPLPRVS